MLSHFHWAIVDHKMIRNCYAMNIRSRLFSRGVEFHCVAAMQVGQYTCMRGSYEN